MRDRKEELIEEYVKGGWTREEAEEKAEAIFDDESFLFRFPSYDAEYGDGSDLLRWRNGF